MALVEISDEALEQLKKLEEKFGINKSELLNSSINYASQFEKDTLKDNVGIEGVMGLNLAYIACSSLMMKQTNAAKMEFECDHVHVTVRDLNSSDTDEDFTASFPTDQEVHPTTNLQS